MSDKMHPQPNPEWPNTPVATILDSISDGVFTVDSDWRITSFNHAAEEITGVPRQEAIGRQCCDVFRTNVCEAQCVLRKTLDTGQSIVNKTVYIIDAEGDRIPISISTALLKDKNGLVIGGVETFRDLSQVEELHKELMKKYSFNDIISKNHRMQQLFEILPEIANSESTTLIEGESGTGKELFARAIHALSPRKNKPFIAVNCGALPDTLLESELFGYKAGAFTDAKKDKPGRFALAEGGTLFLDEIGDISPALQVRLLRVLQERKYEPLGATQTVNANVRIVTATNKNVLKLVEDETFRQDLYYRINVIKLSLPPLRDRKDDIPLLIDHFISHFNQLKNKEIMEIDHSAMYVLVNHDYPGNIRELENIIEHAFILCQSSLIEMKHIPEYLRPDDHESGIQSIPTTIKQMEYRMIVGALKRNNWNRLAAARELGIHKSTLFRKITSLDIELPPEDGRSKRSQE
jgi:PAS domain S-box-containing protein